jgi:hypothetical protein
MNAEYEEQAQAEMRARWGELVEVDVRFGDLWALMSAAQLAMRHPQMSPVMYASLRRVTQDIIDGLAPNPGPLRALGLAGYDPAQDE